ncbi:uncharacterized protein cldc1 [Genypterus blacodes]|uniref:uncharacterized protein cldc1 n=1 Tax=Genypterus blacodes TaxID=154954 RepID=UPI003F75E176
MALPRLPQHCSVGLKAAIECLTSQSALLLLIDFLASICSNITPTLLCKQSDAILCFRSVLSYFSRFLPYSFRHRYWDQWSSDPDNQKPEGELREDCDTLNSHSKTWFDVPCDHISKRIRQMDVLQLC